MSGRKRIANPSRRRRGLLLIVVMWVTLGLVAMALLMGDSMRLEMRAAENTAAGLAAGQAVEGARRYLIQTLGELEERGRMPEEDELLVEAVAVGEAHFWVIGRANDDRVTGEPSYGLIDEAGKLNINVASREMIERLGLRLPGLTAEHAAAIVDWRDEDEEMLEGGAESSYYLLRQSAHVAKNAPFETVKELMLVAGMDAALLVGGDANMNGVLDENENDGDASWPDDAGDGQLEPGLLAYVTVWSREPNQSAEGAPRSDLRQAQSLRPVLSEELGEERAGALIAAVGEQALAQIESVLELAARAGMTPEELDQVGDMLTAAEGEYLTGLVNAATAPSAVLACIPGIDENLAETIVATRQGRTASELAQMGWLLEALGPVAAREGGRWLTTRSDVFSADVAAVGAHGRGFRRDLLVIDTAGGTPAVVHRRDRTPMGWPLGATALDGLTAGVSGGSTRSSGVSGLRVSTGTSGVSR